MHTRNLVSVTEYSFVFNIYDLLPSENVPIGFQNSKISSFSSPQGQILLLSRTICLDKAEVFVSSLVNQCPNLIVSAFVYFSTSLSPSQIMSPFPSSPHSYLFPSPSSLFLPLFFFINIIFCFDINCSNALRLRLWFRFAFHITFMHYVQAISCDGSFFIWTLFIY